MIGLVWRCSQRGSSDEKAAGPSTRKRQASRKRRALLDILEQVQLHGFALKPSCAQNIMSERS